jgi:hypothetical protein
MSVEEFVHMLGGDISKHEFINNELVEMFMGIPLTTYVELDFINDLIDTLDMDEQQSPPIVDLVMQNTMHQYCFILWCTTLLTLVLLMLLAFKG